MHTEQQLHRCNRNAEIIERTLHEYYEITFPYTSMNDVMKILKEEDVRSIRTDI